MEERRNGFTLIEVLVAIAIIGVLVALLFAGRAGVTVKRPAAPEVQKQSALVNWVLLPF